MSGSSAISTKHEGKSISQTWHRKEQIQEIRIALPDCRGAGLKENAAKRMKTKHDNLYLIWHAN
jgi:hypothetical protein